MTKRILKYATRDHTLVRNREEYRIIIDEGSRCSTEKPELLIVVHSAIEHVKMREEIRLTWGESKRLAEVRTNICR